MLREINVGRAVGSRPIAVSTLRRFCKTRRLLEGDTALQVLLWLGQPPERFVAGTLVDETHALPVLADHQILRWDLTRLYRALDEKRTVAGMSWQTLATKLGTSPAVLRHLEKGGRSALPQLMNWVVWVDQPAARFTRASRR